MHLCQGSLWLLVVAIAGTVYSLPSGPPLGGANFDNVCNALRPNPTSPHGDGSNGNGGYSLEIAPPMVLVANGFTYEPNTTYTIRIVNGTIQGFLVQARLPNDTPTLGTNGMLLGSFQSGSGQQIYDCDMIGGATEATITHSRGQNANSVQFTWTAPMTAGNVDFYYTVVRQTDTHFDANSASQVGVTFATLPPPTVAGSTVATTPTPPLTTATQVNMPTTDPLDSLTVPQRAPEDYAINITVPEGCVRADCDLFIGIDVNTGDDGFLDIYMEGNAGGWLAVGFSDTDNMFAADVVACNRLGDDVDAIDGWNPASGRISERDAIQNIRLHSGTFNNGRILCTVSKQISPSGSQDLDLSQPLFVIYARRLSASSTLTNIGTHAGGGTAVRGVTGGRIDVSIGSGNTGQSTFLAVHQPNLVRAHGILMIIAWPLLAYTAILFASIMKPALPNGEWFQVHRALMLISLATTLVAFVLIFIAIMGPSTSAPLNTAHMVIGIIAVALQLTNPIIGLLRCNPKHKYRWVFNLLHGTFIGYILQFLIGLNVPFGLSIFSRGFSTPFMDNLAPLWLYVAWAVAFFLVFLSISLISYVTYQRNKDSADKKDDNGGKEMEMTSAGAGEKEGEKPERKPPSKDAHLRWIAIAIFLVLTVPVMFTIIVLIALR